MRCQKSVVQSPKFKQIRVVCATLTNVTPTNCVSMTRPEEVSEFFPKNKIASILNDPESWLLRLSNSQPTCVYRDNPVLRCFMTEKNTKIPRDLKLEYDPQDFARQLLTVVKDGELTEGEYSESLGLMHRCIHRVICDVPARRTVGTQDWLKGLEDLANVFGEELRRYSSIADNPSADFKHGKFSLFNFMFTRAIYDSVEKELPYSDFKSSAGAIAALAGCPDVELSSWNEWHFHTSRVSCLHKKVRDFDALKAYIEKYVTDEKCKEEFRKADPGGEPVYLTAHACYNANFGVIATTDFLHTTFIPALRQDAASTEKILQMVSEIEFPDLAQIKDLLEKTGSLKGSDLTKNPNFHIDRLDLKLQESIATHFVRFLKQALSDIE